MDFANPLVILILPLYGLIYTDGAPFSHRIELPSPDVLAIRAQLPNINPAIWNHFRKRMINTTDSEKLKYDKK